MGGPPMPRDFSRDDVGSAFGGRLLQALVTQTRRPRQTLRTPPLERREMFTSTTMKTFLIASGAILLLCQACSAQTIDADLLIVGGNESGCAAAVQAARLGVKHIVLVNDIQWLGGQFSAEGLGCPDEWTTVNGKRVNFPRSGLFLEVVRRMRAHNSSRYGVACPGN